VPVRWWHLAPKSSKKHRMGQHQVDQNRLIKTHCAVLDEALEILLEASVSELGAKDFVLAE
jgi:hypothetical protein